MKKCWEIVNFNHCRSQLQGIRIHWILDLCCQFRKKCETNFRGKIFRGKKSLKTKPVPQQLVTTEEFVESIQSLNDEFCSSMLHHILRHDLSYFDLCGSIFRMRIQNHKVAEYGCNIRYPIVFASQIQEKVGYPAVRRKKQQDLL